MTLILLFLFLVLDFQHPPIPDLPYLDFRVTDLTEFAWLGCSMNPMDGCENVPAELTVDWADTFNDQTNSPTVPSLQEFQSQRSVAPMRMIDDNPGIPVAPPDPNPPQPVATPEPPPIAMLTLAGLALLYLLFGYSRRLRLYYRK